MGSITSSRITDAVADAVGDINFTITTDIRQYLKSHLNRLSGREKEVVDILLSNAEIAKEKSIPLCQDTGTVVVFAEIGNDVTLEEPINISINRGVARGYQKHFLRKSIVGDPINRENTADNTPAVIHIDHIEGSEVRLLIGAKGGGSENVSTVAMLSPSEGIEGIRTFVSEHIRKHGANACPPLIIGVGIGGNFESCAVMAKRALFRTIGKRHPNQVYGKLETAILKDVNALGIGAGGFGGKLTAMDVFVETTPCHIASLPVAVNVGCHSTKHTTRILSA